jgi:hypothetical protein
MIAFSTSYSSAEVALVFYLDKQNIHASPSASPDGAKDALLFLLIANFPKS